MERAPLRLMWRSGCFIWPVLVSLMSLARQVVVTTDEDLVWSTELDEGALPAA